MQSKTADFRQAIFQASLTVLRNVIGQNNLDDVLKNRDNINSSLLRIVDEITDPWGLKVELVEMMDVEIPESMQRARATEAEAVRETRARIIKAEGEAEASRMLSEAAQEITGNPYSLELRRMQMITEVGAEHNTTTIMMIPSEFVSMAKDIGTLAKELKKDMYPHIDRRLPIMAAGFIFYLTMSNIEILLKIEISIFANGGGGSAQSEISNPDGADVLYSFVPEKRVLRHGHHGPDPCHDRRPGQCRLRHPL